MAAAHGMLSLVFAESALELVPKEIWRHPAVASDARRRESEPGEVLLDRSFHHGAMLKLKDSERRGRPDLVHVALLSVTGTPLYLDGRVKVYVHTCVDSVVELEPKTRIPKSYLRFRGLLEKCLTEKPSEGLLRYHATKFPELLRQVRPAKAFGLSVRGRQTGLGDLAKEVVASEDACVTIGGFPRGHFSPEVEGCFDGLVRIDPMPLEAHVVAARVVYELEKASGRFND